VNRNTKSAITLSVALRFLYIIIVNEHHLGLPGHSVFVGNKKNRWKI